MITDEQLDLWERIEKDLAKDMGPDAANKLILLLIAEIRLLKKQLEKKD